MNKSTNEKSALIIVDVQRDYFEGGLNPLSQPNEALENIRDLLGVFREKNLPVFHVQHISERDNAPFFKPKSKGIEIHPALHPLESEQVVVKHAPNSFYKTELEAALKAHQVNKLIICGMMSHHCIDTTVRAGRERGYAIDLVHDGCATKNLEFYGQVIEAKWVQKVFMAALQGFANVCSADMAIERLKG